MTAPVFHHGTEARIYYHTFDFSHFCQGADLKIDRNSADYKPLDVQYVIRLMGHLASSLALTGGALDSDVGSNADVAWAALRDADPRPFAVLPIGDAVGRTCFCGQARGNNKQVTVGDDIVRLPVGFVNTLNVDMNSVILRALAAGGTSPGSSVNNADDSHNGGAAYALCTALGAGTSLQITFQQSTNNTDWTTLVAMTALTAAGSEVKVVAPSTTVAQYTRISWAFTGGTPTGTWFAAFARR